ncbi:MAG TPA: hypothetical protein PLX87_12315 [Bacteroidales bacterium]|nr:hypothetical protein [Bacteroidales bacterium]HPP93649.1 hypothetical protein [Bacteroidales bacterium]
MIKAQKLRYCKSICPLSGDSGVKTKKEAFETAPGMWAEILW